LLYKYLGGVDSFPLVLSTQKEGDITNVCRWIAPSIGGINLEDIEKPKCYKHTRSCPRELDIPVWHDDRQGTGRCFGRVHKRIESRWKKHLIKSLWPWSCGASNTAVLDFLIAAGLNPKNVFMVDTKGILNSDRRELQTEDPVKWENRCDDQTGRIGTVEYPRP